MKISQREKNLILVLLGLLLVLASYYLGYRTLQEQNEELKMQNQSLDSQIEVLQTISGEKDKYVKETENLQKEMDEFIQRFPSTLYEEDIIFYTKNIEQETNAYISSVTTPDLQAVSIAAPEETNLLRQFQDITGVISAYGFHNDGKVPDTSNMYLSKAESNVAYSVTYDGLKKMLKSITQDSNRKSIDNVSLVFNENTGDLAGSMTVNYFTLSGTGKEYLQPSVKGTLHGVDCIFGNLKTRAGADNLEDEEE